MIVIFKVKPWMYDVFTGKGWREWSRVIVRQGEGAVIKGKPLSNDEIREVVKYHG